MRATSAASVAATQPSAAIQISRFPKEQRRPTWQRKRLLIGAVTCALLGVPMYLMGRMSLVATISRVSTSVAAAPDANRVHIGEPLGAMVHVCVATSSWPPLGILGLINSTLSHAANRSAIIFHVVAPPEQHPQLVVIESMFPDATIRVVGMATNGVEDKLRSRLRALSQGAGSGRAAVGKASAKEASAKEPAVITEERIYSSWALVYVAALFPKLRRLLWLEPNTLVRTDLHTLWRQPLRGMPVGAVADCENPVESAVNASLMTMARSPRVAARGCGFDTGVLLVDLLQWAATDVTARTEGCMQCAVCMCTARTPHVHHVQVARTGCTYRLHARCMHTACKLRAHAACACACAGACRVLGLAVPAHSW